ncbi:MAG: radical SAM protein [Candidatus Omnitrophica bacterium]|nr:radical SAM protein [Candidatus Omnitrophota bacterium]
MKIAFIIANSPEVKHLIPLGPLYLASYLRSQGYHDITIIDARHERLSDKAVSRRIKALSPDVVGISGMSMESAHVHRLARLAKEIDANCKVIVGGPYATSSPEHIMKDQNVDFVVIGEGERTAARLINALQEGKDFSEIDGMAFKNNGTCVVNPVQSAIEDLDVIPFPAWDIINMEGYFKDIRNHSQNPIPTSNRIASLFTSRGCPYQCTYCHNIFGKKIRFRSVENVIEEIEALIKNYGVQEIEVIDDCFNFDLPRAKRICDEIIRRGIKIALSFPNGLRVDRMDEELIVKLKQAGARVIFYAIESASPRIQKIVKKNLDLDKARHIIAQTIKQGIVTCGYFMLGFPGETKEEVLQTLRFAKDAGFHIADFFYLIPQPKTEIFNELDRENVKLKKFSAHDYHKFSTNASSLSDRELKRMHAKLFREFYLRPRQMWRIWKILPNKIRSLQEAFMVLLYSVAD